MTAFANWVPTTNRSTKCANASKNLRPAKWSIKPIVQSVRNGWDEFDILPVYRSLLMNRSEEAEKKLALPQAALKAAWAFRQGSTSMIRLYPGALDMIEALQEAGRRRGAAKQRTSLLYSPRTGNDRLGERTGRRDYLQRRENPQACPRLVHGWLSTASS